MTNGQVGTDCKFADILNLASVISCLHKFETACMKHLLLFWPQMQSDSLWYVKAMAMM